MTNSHVKSSRMKDKFTGLGASFLKRYMPQRARRAIFVSSLAAYVKNLSCPDRLLADRLTRVLNLSCAPSSLMFPMGLQHRIWKSLTERDIQVNTHQMPTANDIRDFAATVLANTPDWLLYETPRSMREDVYQIVTHFHPQCIRPA